MNNIIKKQFDAIDNQEAICMFFDWLNDFFTNLGLNGDSEKIALVLRKDKVQINCDLNNRVVLSINREKDLFLRIMLSNQDIEAFRKLINFEKEYSFDKSDDSLITVKYDDNLLPHLEAIKTEWLLCCKKFGPLQQSSKDRNKHEPVLYELVKNREELETYFNGNKNEIMEEIINKLPEFAKIADNWFATEANWLNQRYTFFQDFFEEENLNILTWEKIQKLGENLHSLTSLALAKSRAVGNPMLSDEEYIKRFLYLKNNRDDIETKLQNLTLKNKEYKLPNFGMASVSELFTYAFPDKYIFLNSRHEAVLKANGISLESNDKVKRYIEFNELVNKYGLPEKYKEFVGEKTNTSIYLELDQFFSWLYENLSNSDTKFEALIEELENEFIENNTFSFEIENKENIDKKIIKGNKIKDVNWIWIRDNLNLIGNFKVHYELYSDNNIVKVAVHFEEKKEEKDKKFVSKIKEISKNYDTIDWNIRKHSSWKDHSEVIVKENFDLNDLEVTKKIYKALSELDNTLGNQIRAILKGEEPKMNQHLNQILYGPPGTGKTYNTINRALAIIKPEIDFNVSRTELKKIFDDYIKEGRIVFSTFHQSMSYEDFIEGIKPITAEGEVTYEIQNGIFKKIAIDAAFEFVDKEKYDLENLNEKEKIKIEAIKKIDWKEIDENRIKNTLPYVLIIDEINRGNVSAIFGELITLIEESKRLGKAEALTVTLPYSKESFGVPPNLYIIGTMNTADRSVEALDTALRRRFVFEEMMPKLDVIKNEGKLEKENEGLSNEKLVEILLTINNRIEVLLSRDHLIGHSYFLEVDSWEKLNETFYKNIIPLLQEYFYGDYGKIGLVLGSGFVEKTKSESNIFGDFVNDYDGYLEKDIYKVKSNNITFNIQEAISQLLKNGKKQD